ncbi:MAG: TraB/GumN family protein [Comamonadaceae bacterium]|nr:MAG: TraB/GumN family protein [Comamonadaceae bacterium]
MRERHLLARALVAFGLAAAALLASAQEARNCPPKAALPTADTFAAAARQAADRGFLWRITRDGRASFLYGTLHVGKPGWMAPGPLMQEALAASDTIGLELDPLDEAVQREMAAGMAARPPVKLPRALDARLRQALDAACLTGQALAGMPVELQAFTLVLSAGRREGLEPTYGSEILLAMLGHGGGRRVVSLETAALQLQALLAKDEAGAVDMVDGLLNDLDSGLTATVLSRSVKAWEAADLDDLTRYDEWCECMRTQAERDLMVRLLDGRNPGLAARIDALHAEGRRVFAAVGAMHMIGRQGLPALMRSRGYEVQRLR